MAVAGLVLVGDAMGKQQQQGRQVFLAWVGRTQHRLLQCRQVKIVGKACTFTAYERQVKTQVNLERKADVRTDVKIGDTDLNAGRHSAERQVPAETGIGINVERFGETAHRGVKGKLQDNHTTGCGGIDTYTEAHKSGRAPINGS